MTDAGKKNPQILSEDCHREPLGRNGSGIKASEAKDQAHCHATDSQRRAALVGRLSPACANAYPTRNLPLRRILRLMILRPPGVLLRVRKPTFFRRLDLLFVTLSFIAGSSWRAKQASGGRVLRQIQICPLMISI